MFRVHDMPHGARFTAGEGTTFRLWAPAHRRIDLAIEGFEPRPMAMLDGGWHELRVPEAGPGTLYRFRLPDGLMVPDPASRFQPRDVHGPSEVVDPTAYRWADGAWSGRPWHEIVLYELHVGTFTPEGTFMAAAGRLDHLVRLGINAIEIMPVGDFPGARNWGYDGVLPYAPDAAYGRPEDFKALVEAAHGRGISVILDVVYNHFGPDGNYLGAYAPDFFTDRHQTPWGAAVNFDGKDSGPVRDFAIHNALYWIDEFHLDGLRLDAVHAIVDDGSPHVLHELAERTRAAIRTRPLHLILENEENEVTPLLREDDGTVDRYTAQWNDDMHHVLHVAASGEGVGYYADYLGDTEKLGRSLAHGFAFQGEVMPYRDSERGEPSAGLPPTAFVSFIQNHDQIGNRAFGDRINSFSPPEAVAAVSTVYLLLPQVPMMFMGEEWAAVEPFPFFCDFEGDLADAIRKGRRAEFAKFPAFRDEVQRERIPDPLADETFASAKLDWSAVDRDEHRGALIRTGALIDARRRHIMPLIARIGGFAGRYRIVGHQAVEVRWRTRDGHELRLDANLKGAPQLGFAAPAGETIWCEGEAHGGRLGPWAVLWTVGRVA